jgi:EmrB/QacA subfamily drug resistance transporter
VVALTLCVLVVGLDGFVLITALPTLSTELHASTGQLQWITIAYNLAWAGLLLPIGKFGDRFGLRRVLLAGLVVFGVSSVVAGQVNTADQLIWARAAMGVGAAVIMPMTLALIPVIFPVAADRRRAVALITVGAMIGLPLGPLLAGWLLDHFYWGSVFLINGPVVALSVTGVVLWVPESTDPAAPKIDLLGSALAAAGLMSLTYGIIEQPAYGWDTRVVGTIAAGLLITAGFVVRQTRTRSPLADPRLLLNRTFTWGTVSFAVISFAMGGVLFVLSPYLQIVQNHDAQGTGVRLLPMIGAMLVAAAASEKLAGRLGEKIVIPAGMAISTAGLAVLSQITATSGYAFVAEALAVFGIGLGLALPLAADSVLHALPPHQNGMGNAMSRTLQQVGTTTGTALLGSVLNTTYRGRVAHTVGGLPKAARDTAKDGLAGAHGVAARSPHGFGTTLVHAADRAYAVGIGHAMYVSTGLVAVSAVLTLAFLPSRGNEVHAAAEDAVPEPRTASAAPAVSDHSER